MTVAVVTPTVECKIPKLGEASHTSLPLVAMSAMSPGNPVMAVQVTRSVENFTANPSMT